MIDDVPTDTVMELTADLTRAFKFAGCAPTCHACQRSIEVGSKFQLISYEGTDEMLCGRCDRKGLRRAKAIPCSEAMK